MARKKKRGQTRDACASSMWWLNSEAQISRYTAFLINHTLHGSTLHNSNTILLFTCLLIIVI